PRMGMRRWPRPSPFRPRGGTLRLLGCRSTRSEYVVVQGESVAPVQVPDLYSFPLLAFQGWRVHSRLCWISLHSYPASNGHVANGVSSHSGTGGYALFTVHDEHTWQYLSENETQR